MPLFMMHIWMKNYVARFNHLTSKIRKKKAPAIMDLKPTLSLKEYSSLGIDVMAKQFIIIPQLKN
jgi:hypothetical protein